MPIDMFGLVIGKVQAENRGLQPPDSTQIGLIGSMMSNPVMSLVVSRSLADKKLEELTPPPAPTTGEPEPGEPHTDFERHLQQQVDTLSSKVDAMQATLSEIEKKLPQTPPPESQGDLKARSKGGG